MEAGELALLGLVGGGALWLVLRRPPPPPPVSSANAPGTSGVADTLTGLSTAGCQLGSSIAGVPGVAKFCKYTPFNILVNNRQTIKVAGQATWGAVSNAAHAVTSGVGTVVSAPVKLLRAIF